MTWLLWSTLIIAQSAAATVSIRAKASGSTLYTGLASAVSSAIWIASLQILLDFHTQETSWGLIAAVFVAASVLGSSMSQFIARRYFERGKRRVGA